MALQAPIVHALRGKEHVEWDYSYDVGMTGLIGFASGCHAMEACDALLMFCTDFPYRQFSPKGAQIAQVDLRAEVLGRRAPIALGLPGDVKAMVEALLPRLAGGRAGPLRPDPGRARRARLRPGGGRLHPQHVARVLSELADEHAVFTADVGLPTAWGAPPRDERQAAADRLLLARLHGQRHAARDRGQGDRISECGEEA